MTRFKNILRRTYRDDETLTLMKLGLSEEKDELGFANEAYIPVQKLRGIIQEPQYLDIDLISIIPSCTSGTLSAINIAKKLLSVLDSMI